MPKRPPRSYTMGARAEDMAATRGRIVAAAVELALTHAYEDVTLAAIAAAAGVSHQTVLNHFESKEGVATAAAEVIARDTEAARDRATPGDVAGAVAILVGEYEGIGDANARWAMSAERLGALAPRLEAARKKHRAWLERIVGAALPRAAAPRRRALHALHVATDVFSWRLLRRDLGLDRRETEATLLGLVESILAAGPIARPRSRR